MKAWLWKERQHDLGAPMYDALPGLIILLFGEMLPYDSYNSEAGGTNEMKIEWSLELLLLLPQAVNRPNTWHRIDLCIWHCQKCWTHSRRRNIVPWAYADEIRDKFISISTEFLIELRLWALFPCNVLSEPEWTVLFQDMFFAQDTVFCRSEDFKISNQPNAF